MRTADCMPFMRLGSLMVVLVALTCAGQDQHPNTCADTYVIRVGDELRITVRSEPNLSGWVRVRGDGAVVIRLVGLIPATGLTLEELRLKIADKLRRFVGQPQVQIDIGDEPVVPEHPRKWLFPPDSSTPYPLPEPSYRS